MRTYKGIVCENKSKYTVFLTNTGEFIRGIPIGGTPDIGEEVDFHLVSTFCLSSRLVRPRFIGAVMITAVLVFFIVASMLPMNGKVMAYVQLETDTALELGVNQAGKVISLRYFNETLDGPEKSFDRWKGSSIQTVLDTTIRELSAGTNGVPVIITTVYPNTESQHKVQDIVGSAVQEVQSVYKELTWEIAESTVEERMAANNHEMSIHKFKAGQQNDPMNEKKPSKVDHHKKRNPVKQQREKDIQKSSDKQTRPTPSNEQNNKSEKSKETNELKGSKQKQFEINPNKNRGEGSKHPPAKKGKPTDPSLENNSNKGGQNSTSKKSKGNPHQKKQSGNDNSNKGRDRPEVGNGKR